MENIISNQNTDRTALSSVTTPDLCIDPAECVAPEPTDPCTIVIAGATGDLTARKLIPALFHLYLNDRLPQTFQIVGCARSGMNDNKCQKQKVLIDCMLGDQMLFWRQDSVERSWSFLTPILDRCEDCDDQPDMLEFYQAGSTGSAAVSRLVDMAGEDWNQENGALLWGESYI